MKIQPIILGAGNLALQSDLQKAQFPGCKWGPFQLGPQKFELPSSYGKSDFERAQRFVSLGHRGALGMMEVLSKEGDTGINQAAEKHGFQWLTPGVIGPGAQGAVDLAGEYSPVLAALLVMFGAEISTTLHRIPQSTRGDHRPPVQEAGSFATYPSNPSQSPLMLTSLLERMPSTFRQEVFNAVPEASKRLLKAILEGRTFVDHGLKVISQYEILGEETCYYNVAADVDILMKKAVRFTLLNCDSSLILFGVSHLQQPGDQEARLARKVQLNILFSQARTLQKFFEKKYRQPVRIAIAADVNASPFQIRGGKLIRDNRDWADVEECMKSYRFVTAISEVNDGRIPEHIISHISPSPAEERGGQRRPPEGPTKVLYDHIFVDSEELKVIHIDYSDTDFPDGFDHKPVSAKVIPVDRISRSYSLPIAENSLNSRELKEQSIITT